MGIMNGKLMTSLEIAILAAASIFLTVKAPGVKADQIRPNIILILADDLDDRVSPYWDRAIYQGLDDPLDDTKALLNDEGSTFDNAFSPTPICCPGRATILTGKYGHNTGVLTNGGEHGGWETFVLNGNEERTIAVYLKETGYRTVLFGKYLNGIEKEPTHIPEGWSEWYAFTDSHLYYTGYNYTMNENGMLVIYGEDPEDYSTDVITEKALDFIRRTEVNDDEPFFMYIAPTAPHLPLPPAPRHAVNPYVNADPPEPPNYLEEDISDKSLWLKLSGTRRLRMAQQWHPTDYRNRQGSLYALDDLVKRVVKELDRWGELANTYIVFTSDNGYNMGSHRLIHKMAPYEESILVPLVIRGPYIPRGKTRTEMVFENDYAPTFLEWAGLNIPDDMDGRSLVPLLSNTSISPWRTDILLQYVSGGLMDGIGSELPPWLWILLGIEIPTYRALRTEDYLYVEFYDSNISDKTHFHEYELYDLNTDPYQLGNLIATPEGKLKYRELTEQFDARLDELESCVGIECR